jgi:hypothetical protein
VPSPPPRRSPAWPALPRCGRKRSTPAVVLGIARARIAEEAARRTGDLDLGGLGLTRLPPELSGLRHLRRLNLGRGIEVEGERKLGPAGTVGPPDRIDGRLGSVGLLSGLEALSVGGTDLGGLEDLAGLKRLRWLDCTGTRVSVSVVECFETLGRSG